MKVIYKKTILDKLLEKKNEAERNYKKIDYFLLTLEEWDELRAIDTYHLTSNYDLSIWDNPYPPEANHFEIVELWKGCHKARFRVEHYKVLGERIVVAPKEYHQ